MSLNEVKVEFGFNVATLGQIGFVLDSTVDGILGTNLLAGLEFYDVTYLVRSVTIDRGRSRQLDYFRSGSATIVLNNNNREFDPLNASSPYYPAVLPRSLVRITCRGLPIFYGLVSDWDIDYDITGFDLAVAKCSDVFLVLSNIQLSAFTPSAQKTGNRINTVLNRTEVNFVGGRDIDTGLSDVGAYAVAAGTNVLNYLRQLERSEYGFLFVSSNGDLVFISRGNTYKTTINSFSDDGTAIPYRSLKAQYGDELLYNSIEVTSPAGTSTSTDQQSINKYQISNLELTDLLNSSTGVLSLISQTLLSRYKEPAVRLTGFDVQLLALSETDKDAVLDIDLLSFVNLTKSFSVGSPSSKTDFSMITGINHDIRPDSHRISFTIEGATGVYFLLLGNDVSGRLDYFILDQ